MGRIHENDADTLGKQIPAPAEVVTTPGIIPGYKIVDQQWEFNLENGETVVLTGTVQEVVAKLKVLQPGYELEVSSSPAPTSENPSALLKRQSWKIASTNYRGR